MIINKEIYEYLVYINNNNKIYVNIEVNKYIIYTITIYIIIKINIIITFKYITLCIINILIKEKLLIIYDNNNILYNRLYIDTVIYNFKINEYRIYIYL